MIKGLFARSLSNTAIVLGSFPDVPFDGNYIDPITSSAALLRSVEVFCKDAELSSSGVVSPVRSTVSMIEKRLALLSSGVSLGLFIGIFFSGSATVVFFS